MSNPTQLLSASGLRESEQRGEPPITSPFLSDGAAPCLRRHSTLARMLLASPMRHVRCIAVARIHNIGAAALTSMLGTSRSSASITWLGVGFGFGLGVA